MKVNLPIVWLSLLWLLVACSQPPPAETSAPPTNSPPTAAPVPTPTLSAPKASAPLVAAQLYESFAAAADTVLHLSGRQYRLIWRVRLDTLHPLLHITPPNAAKHFSGDTSQGFQGYYTVEVRDSLGHRLGRHIFTKPDFYPAVGPALAISSEVELPQLLGYSKPLGGLVFTVPFNAPGTDWCSQAALVLAPTGQVRYLGPGYECGGPAVPVMLAADGRTLLTIKEIRHAGRPPIPLGRAGAELRGATLLNDTLALVIYELGRSRTQANGMPYLEATSAQRRQPNAFVRDVRTGREMSHFRYNGFYEELGYTIPMTVVLRAQAAYLLDAASGLYVLPLRQPATGRLLPFAAMPRVAGSPAASEVSFNLASLLQRYRFLVDTAQAMRVRYQLLPD